MGTGSGWVVSGTGLVRLWYGSDQELGLDKVPIRSRKGPEKGVLGGVNRSPECPGREGV